MSDKLRLDKWLWAARFFKTRSLAVEALGKGRVQLNGQPAKPARDVGPGDLVTVRRGEQVMTVRVQGVSSIRGPAPVAQQLYEETEESRTARERAADQRRLAPEPGQDLAAGRPTKRDRRELDRWRGG